MFHSIFGRKKTEHEEDMVIQMAQDAVCRYNKVIGDRGPVLKPFTINPRGTAISDDTVIKIKPERVIIALMVAPRRSGKTTLLTSLCREFHKVMGDDFVMESYQMGKEKLDKLQKNYKALFDFANAPRIHPGLAPSDTQEVYEYAIYSKSHPRMSLMLRFIDVPGEWVESHQEAMKILISGADILYLTINAPALMEQGGDYNKEFNATPTIVKLTDILKSEQISRRERLLLFVPIKCEKYYWEMISGDNPTSMRTLNQTIRSSYGELIKTLGGSERLKDSTTVAITPVLSIGGSKFDQFVPIDGTKLHEDRHVRVYGYISDQKGYRPTFCEQPLLFTLRFIRAIVMKQVRKSAAITFFVDAREQGIKKAFKYAFRDPLIETISQKTKYADFSAFHTIEDFQKTESPDGSVPEKEYPDGLYTNVDALGYSTIQITRDMMEAES